MYKCSNKELNQVLSGTNPAGGQGGNGTRDLLISSPHPNHWATLPPNKHLCQFDLLNVYYGVSHSGNKPL